MAARPDALLLVAPGCVYCPIVLQSLADAIKAGRLARLEVVNTVEYPEVAKAVGTRTVPWLRIGPFELDGNYTPGELAEWIEHAAQGTGWEQYFSSLLAQGRLLQALKRVQEDPARLAQVIALAGSLDTPMAVRVGVSAVLEELAGSTALRRHIPELVALTRSPEPQVRADACHYLALTNTCKAAEHVRPLLDDGDASVREIAQETLDWLAAKPHQELS
ncbi:MAG: HEAT repeat domain-containing protein [Gammaproteobacteria bacterium]